MFVRRETIGDTKVNITELPVDLLPLTRAIAEVRTSKDDSEAFVVVNLDAVYERVKLWLRELPQVEPFYAVKCNPDPVMVQMMVELGVGFDCASREEIDHVMQLGAAADQIIYANPSKYHKFIAHADDVGVNMMTFDSVAELEKIAKYHTSPELILRIAVNDPTAFYPLSFKFGSDPVEVAPGLLKRAAELNLNIVGVSFHVGSGCNDPTTFRVALQHTRNLFDLGRSLGHKMEIVDVGGGFPGGEHHIPFETFAAIIRSSLAEFFPVPDVRFVAEPGRFFAARPFTLVTSVIAHTVVTADKITNDERDAAADGHFYYINDGVYGSFCCIRNKTYEPFGRPLFDEPGPLYPSMVWGPTCDSQDKVEDNKLMRELDVGDWLIYENMGAYTFAAATSFNGFPRAAPIYVISERTWKTLGL